ncbi:NUDIX hydrolase [Heyndrickxia acidicola]|uniref:CoA pyrophosphatase n=1 Tax=Heyndrickxia acidicola TaxID=209389 RepID=A0ABU6MD95_9BACI|nr:CoA pyrophosphatase [Heyndrickxia acidicola]MED1201628.1 CoA pyrophosphatase [Heyndrickxia acidicola]
MDINQQMKKLSKRKPDILGIEDFSKFGILIPLINKNGEDHVLFEVRSSHLRRQPGEICFPGGRIEETDPTPIDAAIRETSEELGILSQDITNVIPLDHMLSAFGSRLIYPCAGMIKKTAEIQPNPEEVEEVFTIPVEKLMEMTPKVYKIGFQIKPEENFPFHLINGGKEYNWQIRQVDELFYQWENRVIWGLTASLLKHFLDLVKTT